MKKIVAASFVALLLSVAGAHAATTYSYTGAPITNVVPYTSPCTNGANCQNYTAGTHITGSFTVATPLAANLTSQEIGSTITAYSFTDGISTYTNTDANSRKFRFQVTTNSSGQITASDVVLHQWQLAAPHSVGSTAAGRFNFVAINTSSGAQHNRPCDGSIGTSASGDADDCTVSNNSAADTSAEDTSGAAGVWTNPAVSSVPTLSEWALGLMATLILGVGAALVGQRRRSMIA